MQPGVMNLLGDRYLFLNAKRRREVAKFVQTVMIVADETIQQGDDRFVEPADMLAAWHETRPGELFAFDRSWFDPLLKTPKGVEVLGQLLAISYFEVEEYRCYIEPEEAMRACLCVQSRLMTHPHLAHELLLVLSSFADPVFEAIQHYIHPDQAEALVQLKASTPLPPPSITVPQHDIPPEAIPLLFPHIDTTQFAPQFDWFVYLLSKFSLVNYDSNSRVNAYDDNLSTLIDTIFHPTEFLSLKPGLSLDKVFTHNHLFNSYDEFLHHKLPQVLPLVQSMADAQFNSSPPTSPNLIFPYFPDQHPILTSIESKDEFSELLSGGTPTFETYFTHMFILGPWIQSTTSIPPFKTLPIFTSVCLTNQLNTHQYRVWHLKNTPTASSSSVGARSTNKATTSTATTSTATTNTAPVDSLKPPDFTTSPFALLALTVVPSKPIPLDRVIPSNQLPQPLEWHNHQPPTAGPAYYRFLFHILAHYPFPDDPTRDAIVDKVLIQLLSSRQYVPNLTKFSSALQQHGYTTLHQHAHRLLLNANTNGISCDQLERLVSDFLLQPLIDFPWHGAPSWSYLAQHITLCVHAGFLAPSPLPPPPLQTSPPHIVNPNARPDEVKSKAESFSQASYALATLRGTLHALLVRFTGFISYFPQSTQLLANAVHTIASRLEFSEGDLLWDSDQWNWNHMQLPFFPPHSPTITDPRDTCLSIKMCVIDDDGKLYTIKYLAGSDDQDEGMDEDAGEAHEDIVDDEDIVEDMDEDIVLVEDAAENVEEDQSLADVQISAHVQTSANEEEEQIDEDIDFDEDEDADLYFDQDGDVDEDEAEEETVEEVAVKVVKEPKNWRDTHLPFSFPGHLMHISYDKVIDDLVLCVTWSDKQVVQFPELGHLADCDPYSYPPLSAKNVAFFASERNQKILNLPRTRELQTQLTAYFRQVNEVESAMVASKMQNVLTKACETGIFDASNAGQKRKRPPRSSSRNAPPVEPISDASTAALKSQHPTYPFPTIPETPMMFYDYTPKIYDDNTFPERGVLYPPVKGSECQGFFYDYNYAPTRFTKGYRADLPKDMPKSLLTKYGDIKADGTFSVVDFFRQRSEWALEFLIVGCLGLDAASTRTAPTHIQIQPPPSLPVPRTRSSVREPKPTYIQQCKDHLLQRLPTLVSEEQPTPPVSQSGDLDPQLQKRQVRLRFYHDKLDNLTLLTTLPLYDTLASLQ